MMWAELADSGGSVIRSVEVPNDLIPDHIYCDTCGDCMICSPHDDEDWCRTGGRWVIYEGDEIYEQVSTSVATK